MDRRQARAASAARFAGPRDHAAARARPSEDRGRPARRSGAAGPAAGRVPAGTSSRWNRSIEVDVMKAVVVYESLWATPPRSPGRSPRAWAPTPRRSRPTRPPARSSPRPTSSSPARPSSRSTSRTTRPGRGSRGPRADAPTPPDTSHPSLRTWLPELPAGHAGARRRSRRASGGRCAGRPGTIERGLRKAGYRTIAKAEKFIVEGKYGPLRDGRARARPRSGATSWLFAAGAASQEGPADGREERRCEMTRVLVVHHDLDLAGPGSRRASSLRLRGRRVRRSDAEPLPGPGRPGMRPGRAG